MIAAWLLVAVIALIGSGLAGNAHAQAGSDVIPSITLDSNQPGQLVITWATPEQTPTDYRIRWANTNLGFPSYSATNEAERGNEYPLVDVNTLTLSSLTPGDSYKVQIRSRYYNADGSVHESSGPWTSTATQRVKDHPPAAPTGLTASLVEHNSLTLTWNNPQDTNITGYRIQRGTDANSLHTIEANTGSPSTNYADSTVEPETTYHYAVQALSQDGNGARAITSGTTPAEPNETVQNDPPAVPTGLTASNVQHDSLTLTWDDPKDDGITGYQVMRGDSATSLSTLQDNTQSVSTEYEDDTVEPETTYHYAVVALSANGDSPQSSTLSATTPAEPSSGQQDEPRKPPKEKDPPQRVGPRQSTTTTFISNTGQALATALTTTRATAFTTGTSTYTLSSVGIHLGAQSGTPTPLVQIYGDTSGNPGTLLATMNNPGSITDNVVNTYTDPANTMLSGSTTYWMVTSNSAAVNGQGFRVGTTDTNNLDSGTAAGWTIGSARYKTDITATSWTTPTRRHLFEIQGTRTDAASGVPAITAPNVFRVPAVLGVDLSGITDPDGVTNIAANATYKWQRFDDTGANLETNSIGTGSTYTLTHTDAGKKLKVVVNFTDDASNSEGPLTSAATLAITAAATDCNAPTYVGGATQIGPARTVTIEQGNDEFLDLQYGFLKRDAFGSLDNTTFTVASNDYEILGIYSVRALTYIRFDQHLTRPDQKKLALHICDQAYSFASRSPLINFAYSFSNPPQDWSPYAERTFYLSQDTAAPTFVSATANGTKLVITLNEPLDAAPNLANSAFTVKKNGSSTPISSTAPVISGRTVTLTLTRAVATSDTNVLVSYTKPTSGEANKLVDTFGNEAATFTDQAVSNTAATGAPTISGIAQVGQTLTASTTSISDTNGLPSMFNYQWKRVDANGTSNSTNIGTDSATYTLTDSEVGKKVLVEVSFTDNANNREGPLVSAAFPSSGTVSAAPTEVPSSWSLKPAGLAVGDQFRLIFLSSTKRNATPTDIADYNTFVQERAAAGHAGIQSYSTGFRVVGCTGAVDARDNTDTIGRGVPIYWLDGTKVADNYADFYDGSWDDEINDKNESGTDAHDTSQEDNYPFTGCQNDGTEETAGAHRPRSLGSTDDNVRIGRLNSSGTLQDPIDGNDVATTAATRPMYGLSVVFQVVAASTDATLSALTVSPKDITGFATDRSTRYEVGVASTVTQATITATKNDSAATVGYSTTDADDSTSGHQVDLSAGRNAVTVTVTAEDTTTTQTHTISINRGVDTAFGWKATDDFDGLITAGNDTPSGPWSDETTMWVSDYVDDKIYAYDLTTKARDASKDFDTLSDAGNENPDGIWSNNITMWVSDYEDSKLYAYSMATKARDAGKDITTAAASAGIWSDGTTIWVAHQQRPAKIHAYTLATGVRDAGKDFDTLTAAGNEYPGGIWSNTTTMWVTDQTDNKIYAYNMASKAHDAGKDFDTLIAADNDRGVGIWANTDTMWVADLQDDKIYSYNMPAIAANAAPTVANAIPDQMATVGTEFSYTFLANTFNDVDATDTLTYTATKGDEAVLPTWLMFSAGTRTFSGTPTAAETFSVKVTASDGTASVTDEFDITVNAAASTDVWTATLTPAATITGFIGCYDNSCATGLSDDDFTYDSTDYTITVLYVITDSSRLTITLDPDITTATNSLTLVVGTSSFAFASANTATTDTRTWTSTGLSWTIGTDVFVKLIEAANTPAAGAPAITAPNVFRVPAVLGVDLSSITDTDGVTNIATNATYKWQRFNAAGTTLETDSIGTDATYTLTDTDATKTLKVVVSFTDDATNSEGPLTSAATSEIIAAATDCNAPTNVGGATQIWTGKLGVKSYSTFHGFHHQEEGSSLETPTFTTASSNDYEIKILNNESVSGNIAIQTDPALSATDKRTLILHICNQGPYEFRLSRFTGTNHTFSNTGHNWSAHAERTVYLSQDTAAPTFATATVNGSTLVVTFNEDLGAAASLINSAFTVKKGSSGTTQTLSGTPSISGSTVTLTLATAVTATDTAVKVAYTKPTSGSANKLRDRFSNETATFTDQEVTNNTTTTTEVPETWSLKPTALNTGDQFRLIFLSSTKRNASPNTIADYNTFVQGRAAAGHTDIRTYSAGFRVVGCTASVDARDNTATTFTTNDKGVPIYWLNGAKVANEYEDFYDGSWDDEANDKDESGTDGLDTSVATNRPFTGCDHDGTEALDGSISQGFAAEGGAKIGRPNSPNSAHGPLSSNGVGTITDTRPMYGISGVFQVAEPTNTPATGEPTITGTAAAGQTLTASTTGISDTDGLPSAFTYQWKRVDSDGMSNPTNIGTNSATYTLTNTEVGKKVLVEVSFTDNATNSEGPLVSAAYPSTGTVKAPIGPPQGLTAEAGDERVRLTWTNPTGITEFTEYQYRYAAGTSVPSGTSWTGTGHVEALTLLLSGLTNATAHALEVRVISDGREGAAATVSATPQVAVCNTALGGRREVWSATMTVGGNDGPRVGAIKAGYNSGLYGSFPTNDDRFSIGGTSYTIEYLFTDFDVEGNRRKIFLELVGDSRFTPAVKDAIQLHWCGESSGFSSPTAAGYRASNPNEADWSIYTTRELALSLPANNSATGTPMITGTAVATQALTASTTGISDPDGLPSAFDYQWKRVDSDGVSNPTNIGADAATYTLTNTEVGKKVLVEVSFTDSLGEAESLASAAYPSTGTVRAADNTAPTVTSIERQDPTELLTNSDTPTWRVTFSEAVKNVDGTDFTIAGTTAAPMVTSVGGVTGGYDVTPSGGNIATLTGTITLTFAAAQNIADTADNDLAATGPTGTNEPTFELDNTIPTFRSGTANGAMIVLTFSEELDPGSLPPGSAFDISTNTSVTVNDVSIAGTMVTLTVTPAILVDQNVVVSNNAYAGNSTVPLKDFAGNEVLPAVQSTSYTMINNTPIGPTTTFVAEAGDGRARLVWTNPEGIPGLLGYQYRYVAGTSVPSGTGWTGTGSAEDRTVLLSGLTNGTAYTFEVRAVRGGKVGATATVSATPQVAVCALDLGDRREVWSATMTVGGENTGPLVGSVSAGYRNGRYGSLYANNDTFTIGDASYTIDDIYASVGGDGSRRRILLKPANTGRFTPPVKVAIQLHWCGESSGFEEPISRGYLASNPNDADWSIYNTRELALSLPANNDATGKPAITGTALVGQTLTATKGNVADDDGLPSAFTYQWKRVDSDGVSNPTNIGIDSATYTLTTSEVGKRVLVEVSFTDDLSGAESRTSDVHPSSGTVTVGGSVALREDSYYRFEPADFSYAISSGTLASLTITEMPASGTLTKGGRPINNLPDKIPTTGSQRRTLLYRPPTDAHGTPYTSFKFKVNEETTVHTMTINVTSVNDRAYGKVFISGATQVGYDLTASTSAMGDRDGIPRDQLDYQWKRYAADGITFEADIGTNSSTYTLTSSEQGKKIRVEVSYVDGGGTREATLSAASPYVTDQTIDEVTFQSIMGLAGDTFYDFTADHGQVFTTGTNQNGYTLSRVVLQSEDLQGDDLAVKICGVDPDGDPTAVCTDLTVPGSFTKGLLSFTAPSNTTLTGGRTNYMVVISSPGGSNVRLDATRSDGFDSSALGSGWSIATKTRMNTTEGWQDVNGTRIRIAILGTINP